MVEFDSQEPRNQHISTLSEYKTNTYIKNYIKQSLSAYSVLVFNSTSNFQVKIIH
jgi:hypothetical protein